MSAAQAERLIRCEQRRVAEFRQYPTVNTRVRLFNVGQATGTPRADFTIGAMPANRVATIVLTPPPTGGSATGFMVMPCGS